MGREGAVSPPKLKLGPQNYFPGAGAVFRYIESYRIGHDQGTARPRSRPKAERC